MAERAPSGVGLAPALEFRRRHGASDVTRQDLHGRGWELSVGASFALEKLTGIVQHAVAQLLLTTDAGGSLHMRRLALPAGLVVPMVAGHASSGEMQGCDMRLATVA